MPTEPSSANHHAQARTAVSTGSSQSFTPTPDGKRGERTYPHQPLKVSHSKQERPKKETSEAEIARGGLLYFLLQWPTSTLVNSTERRLFPEPGQVKSRITPRDTWSSRQAGATWPVRRVGWVWAAGCALAAKTAWPGFTCAGAAHKHASLILCFGGFLVPVSPA